MPALPKILRLRHRRIRREGPSLGRQISSFFTSMLSCMICGGKSDGNDVIPFRQDSSPSVEDNGCDPQRCKTPPSSQILTLKKNHDSHTEDIEDLESTETATSNSGQSTARRKHGWVPALQEVNNSENDDRQEIWQRQTESTKTTESQMELPGMVTAIDNFQENVRSMNREKQPSANSKYSERTTSNPLDGSTQPSPGLLQKPSPNLANLRYKKQEFTRVEHRSLSGKEEHHCSKRNQVRPSIPGQASSFQSALKDDNSFSQPPSSHPPYRRYRKQEVTQQDDKSLTSRQGGSKVSKAETRQSFLQKPSNIPSHKAKQNNTFTVEENAAINEILLGDGRRVNGKHEAGIVSSGSEIELESNVKVEKKDKKSIKERKKRRKMLEKTNAWVKSDGNNSDKMGNDSAVKSKEHSAVKNNGHSEVKNKENGQRVRKVRFEDNCDEGVKENENMLLPGAIDEGNSYSQLDKPKVAKNGILKKGQSKPITNDDQDNLSMEIANLLADKTTTRKSGDKTSVSTRRKGQSSRMNSKDQPSSNVPSRGTFPQNNRVETTPVKAVFIEPINRKNENELTVEDLDFFDHENRPTTRERPPERGETFNFGLTLVEVPMTPPPIVPNENSGHSCRYEDYKAQLRERTLRAMSPASRRAAIEEEHKQLLKEQHMAEKFEQVRTRQKAEHDKRMKDRTWADKYDGRRKKKTSSKDEDRNLVMVQPVNNDDDDYDYDAMLSLWKTFL